MAAVTALVMGGTQSVSRTIMGLMTPESRTGEFFGFFNLSGKAFSMLGPIMFTEILKRTDSANWAILSLLVFFVVGWAIIAPLGHRPRPARSPRSKAGTGRYVTSRPKPGSAAGLHRRFALRMHPRIPWRRPAPAVD